MCLKGALLNCLGCPEVNKQAVLFLKLAVSGLTPCTRVGSLLWTPPCSQSPWGRVKPFQVTLIISHWCFYRKQRPFSSIVKDKSIEFIEFQVSSIYKDTALE